MAGINTLTQVVDVFLNMFIELCNPKIPFTNIAMPKIMGSIDAIMVGFNIKITPIVVVIIHLAKSY